MNITHFMWGYQPHFRVRQERNAERHLRALNQSFDPELFLVGVLAEKGSDKFPACVEPEKDFWLESSDVYALRDKLPEIIEKYPESRLMQSHPLAQERQDEFLIRRAIRDAVQDLASTHPQKSAGYRYRASLPVRVGAYWVSVVVGLDEGLATSNYSLKSSVGKLHEYRTFPLTTSLLDALITTFLDQAAEELSRPDPGLSFVEVDADETLRKAGRRLMGDIVWRADEQRMVGREILFHACNTISSLFYEKAVGTGNMVVARRNHPALKQHVAFQHPTQLREFRGARKFLELTLSDLSLQSDSEEVFGLASVEGYTGDSEDLFEIRVLGHHHWELMHAGHLLMRVKYGQPYWPKPTFDADKIRLDLARLFPGIGADNTEKLIALIRQAELESHGTTIIVTTLAHAEAIRLSSQATAIVPCEVTPEILRHLTPIDGALIVAPDATCHAIGAILDGDATAKGDPTRGARFNSAVRYVGSQGKGCLATVVSSDGGVDFIPNLRPAIRKADLDRVLGELSVLSETSSVNRRVFSKLYEWLDARRFYLLEDHCAVANKAVEKIEAVWVASDPHGARIIRSPFNPHPEMDPEMYLC